MGIFAKLLISAGAALLLPLAKTLGEEYENSMFDENRLGYLFNYGAEKYIGYAKGEGQNRVILVDQRNEAGRLNIRIIRDEMGAYAMFTSANDEDTPYCKKPYSPTNPGVAKELLGCPAFRVNTDNPESPVYLTPFNDEYFFRFYFTPAILERKHVMRIIHDDKCLTAEDNGLLVVDFCEYDNLKKKSRQLFMWTEEDIFIKRINPLYALRAESNPDAPYFAPSKEAGDD